MPLMRRRFASRSALALLLTALVACGAPPLREVHREEGALQPAPVSEVKVHPLWYRQSQTGHDVDEALLAPVVDGRRFYFADVGGRVLAVERRHGRLLWRVTLRPDREAGGGERVELTGGLGERAGVLLMGSREGEVFGLARKDGTRLWRGRVSSEVLAPPVSDGRVVVVHVNDGRIFALDGATGERLWVYESSVPALSLRGTSTPLIDSRRLIVGLANGKVLALSLKDGKVIWEATVAVPQGRSELERIVDVDGDPLLRDGVIYAAAYHGRVVALSAATGRVLWSRDISTAHTMALDAGHLYVSDEDGTLWALEPRGGAVLWKQDALQGRGLTAPALDGEIPVVGDNSGYLHWLSPRDGSVLARHRVSEVGLPGPIVVRDEVLYLKDWHNAVYVLETEKVRGGRKQKPQG